MELSTNKLMKLKLALLTASLAVASIACQAQTVKIQFTGNEDPATYNGGADYWNVMEFDKGGSHESISDLLDTSEDSTGISITSEGEPAGHSDSIDPGGNYVVDGGAGPVSFDIDLPEGTFDIAVTVGSGCEASITGDTFTGIEGPTTVTVTISATTAEITTCYDMEIDGY
jgi:hypothetical protein